MQPLPAHLEPFVARLTAARSQLHQLDDLPDTMMPVNSREAYQVHREVIARLGWQAMGWKIAGTTEYIQQALGLDGPIYGRNFIQHRRSNPATLSCAELLDPLVECEFFVTLGKDLAPRDTPWTMDEVVDAIASVHVGIEVAECRLPVALNPSTPAILADGSAAGHYVFGPEVVGWRAGLAEIGVVLECDGEIVKRGRGADVMGDPLRPVLWLAEEFRKNWGEGLYAGELISTGSMTGMLPVRAGQVVRASYDGIGTIDIAFTS